MNVSSCHSMPLNTLAPCLNLCSILQHMASLRWLSSRCHQPISASLEVRTCHLSKSWSLLHNYMLLCHNWWSMQTQYAHKTWENMGIMHREMEMGLRKAPWTNLKPGRNTTATVFNFVLSLRKKIKSSVKPLFGMNMCLWNNWQVCLLSQITMENKYCFSSKIVRDLEKENSTHSFLVLVQCYDTAIQFCCLFTEMKEICISELHEPPG